MAMSDAGIPAGVLREQARPHQEPNYWAQGLLLLAAIVMVTAGSFHVFMGIAGLLSNSFIPVAQRYSFDIGVTAWGIGQVVLGGIVAAAGGLLFTGKSWALIVAAIVAAISAVSSFLSIPYHPAWSILVLVMNVGVIWAIMAHGHDPAFD